MKVTAVLVLLTLCSIAAANLFTERVRRQNPNCFDEACDTFFQSLIATVPECNSSDLAVVCGDECIGAKCQFYVDNGYDPQCTDILAALCVIGADSPSQARVPDACVVQPGRDCIDGGFWRSLTTLPSECILIEEENEDVAFSCTDDCAGDTCWYYNSEDYPANCTMSIANFCNATVGIIPAECGALGQVTVQGVLLVILLIAAFLVF